MALLHFANLAPSAKKGDLLAIHEDGHNFHTAESMPSWIEKHGDNSGWGYIFSVVSITDKTKTELDYLMNDVVLVAGTAEEEYQKKYYFIEPEVGSPFWNELRHKGIVHITFSQFEPYIRERS